MTETKFRNIIFSAIYNLDINYLNELKTNKLYSQTQNYCHIENEIKTLIQIALSKGLSELKIFAHNHENKFSVLTPDMLFIIRYIINKNQDNCFTIEECNSGVPF